jgi:hypothetical protein
MESEPTPKIELSFLKVSAPPSCFAHAQKNFATSDQVVMKPDVSMDDITFEVKSGKKCLAILTIAERNDLAVIVNALFTLKKDIRDRKLMVVVFLKFASDKVEDLLIRSGCSEIFKYDLNAKAFTHKLNRFLKLLEHQETAPDENISVLGDKGESQEGGKKLASRGETVAGFHVHLTEAWSGADDFWLFRKKVYAKKYQNRWLIEIIGPSPAAGSWERAGENIWQWRARPGFDFFDVTPGNWEFKGKQPHYSWVINRWAFVSEDPSLNLVRTGKIIYSRLKLREPNHLEVANNSEYAKSIFQKIKDTYDKDYLLKHEKKGLGELQGTISPDEEIPWADKTNSNDLSTADWNNHDLRPEAKKEWGGSEPTDFLMGAEAMAACGIMGTIKSYAVDLLEYNDSEGTLLLGLDHALVEYKEMLEISVTAENLNLPKELKLRGVVTSIHSEDNLGKSVAVVLMLQNSKEEFNLIRDAVNRRQAEVTEFLKKTKGLD